MSFVFLLFIRCCLVILLIKSWSIFRFLDLWMIWILLFWSLSNRVSFWFSICCVCLFLFMFLCEKILVLIMVLIMLVGICKEVFWMLFVFFLKIVWSSFFLGESCVLFFGVILFIRMLFGRTFASIWMILDSLRFLSVFLFMFGMLWVIFLWFSFVFRAMFLNFLMWIEVKMFFLIICFEMRIEFSKL